MAIENGNAGLRRRLAGLLIDLPLSVIPASVIGHVVSTLQDREPEPSPHVTELDDFLPWPFVIAVLAAFLTPFWLRGFSLGALLLRLRAQHQSTGDRPTLPRAYFRALLTSVSVIAALMLVGGALSDFSAEPNHFDYAAFAGSGTIVVTSLLAYLYSFLDHEHRTLQDRLTGLVVVKLRMGHRSSSGDKDQPDEDGPRAARTARSAQWNRYEA